MRRVALLSILLVLVLAPSTVAQSAQEVLRDALDHYTTEMADVENYTMTQSVMGTETMTYAERADGDAPLDYTYTSYMDTGSGFQSVGAMNEGNTMNPYLVFSQVAEHARYAGTEAVDGEQTHAIAVDNFSEVARDLDMMPQQSGFEVETATFYIDTDEHYTRKMTMTGTMERDGRASPITMTMQFLDYRTANGLTMPFHTVIETQGMESAMDPAEREEMQRQIEEAEAQMASMPEAQRKMMERMMGDQLEQLREMLGGEAMTVEMEVTDLKVNAGPPN